MNMNWMKKKKMTNQTNWSNVFETESQSLYEYKIEKQFAIETLTEFWGLNLDQWVLDNCQVSILDEP